MLPAPAYGQNRKGTESQRIEGPGRSGYVITHRHRSEYQKQSAFASVQPQSLPSRCRSHGPRDASYYSDPRFVPSVRDLHTQSSKKKKKKKTPQSPLRGVRDLKIGVHSDSELARATRAMPMHVEHLRHKVKVDRNPVRSSSKVSSIDDFDMGQRLSRGLTFGFSLERSNLDKSPSVSLIQTSKTSVGHDVVKESKNIIEDESKVYKERIFSVSSSRYTKSLDLRTSVEAELVLQPPPPPTDKSLSRLLTWM